MNTLVSLGLSIRLLINLESLNMAESVGNVTKHRKAPVVIKDDEGYRLVYVPVISGMSLAHHYQHLLAHIAKNMGLNVTRMSLEGYFMKFAEDKIIKNHYPEVAGRVSKNRSQCENEREIIKACTVADVGGFLYTDGLVKRTSRFSFTYLMPAMDALGKGAVGVYPQLHVRYTPEAAKREQALIYVENASALYTMTYLLEASNISRLNACRALGENDDLGVEERVKRFKASVSALAAMIGNTSFGAKRSRSMPHWEIESMIVTTVKSPAPFTPSPGHTPSFIEDTIARLRMQEKIINGFSWHAAYYDKDAGRSVEGAYKAGVPEEAIENAASKAEEWLTQTS